MVDRNKRRSSGLAAFNGRQRVGPIHCCRIDCTLMVLKWLAENAEREGGSGTRENVILDDALDEYIPDSRGHSPYRTVTPRAEPTRTATEPT